MNGEAPAPTPPPEAPKPANPEPLSDKTTDPEKGSVPGPEQGKSEHPKQ